MRLEATDCAVLVLPAVVTSGMFYCSDSDGEGEVSGSDDEAAAAVEFEAATAGQGRKAAGSRGSRKEAAAPPKTRVSGTGRAAAAGGRAGSKTAVVVPRGGSAADAAPASRPAADPGLQSPTGKRRPGESGLQRGFWVVQYVGFLRHPVHKPTPAHLQCHSDTASQVPCQGPWFTPPCTAATQARRS
jgi:hypothetical protein